MARNYQLDPRTVLHGSALAFFILSYLFCCYVFVLINNCPYSSTDFHKKQYYFGIKMLYFLRQSPFFPCYFLNKNVVKSTTLLFNSLLSPSKKGPLSQALGCQSC